MVNSRLFFEFARDNYEAWGGDSFLPMTTKLKDGLLIGILSDNEGEYLIIGVDFIVKTEVEVVINNPSAESGTWEKEYYATE